MRTAVPSSPAPSGFGFPRLFLEVARRSFRRHLTYRAAALAGLVTNVFFGLLRASVLVALYGGQESVEGMTVTDAVTYTGLTQAILAYLAIFGWYDLMNTVYRGEIASDLMRPVNFLGFWMAQDFGRALAALLTRGVTIMAIYALLVDLTVPGTLVGWLAVVVSLFLAWVLSFTYAFLINLAAFWSPDARGIGRFGFVLVMFFSGFLMPLRFFPEWLQRLAEFTPFPHMVNTVVEVYVGVLQGPSLAWALLEQAAWAVGMVALAQLVFSRAMRRLVIQGG